MKSSGETKKESKSGWREGKVHFNGMKEDLLLTCTSLEALLFVGRLVVIYLQEK